MHRWNAHQSCSESGHFQDSYKVYSQYLCSWGNCSRSRTSVVALDCLRFQQGRVKELLHSQSNWSEILRRSLWCLRWSTLRSSKVLCSHSMHKSNLEYQCSSPYSSYPARHSKDQQRPIDPYILDDQLAILSWIHRGCHLLHKLALGLPNHWIIQLL